MRRAVQAFLILLVVGVGLALRLPQLGNRPFHGDEAVHAVKFRELWEKGTYHYDPNEYHGPTIYYAALPVVALKAYRQFGDLQESDFRLAIAVLGAALAGLWLLLRPHFSEKGLLLAGLFTALSPAFVFYSRYFIQEVFLVLFTLLFLACAVKRSVVCAGVFAGLMLATKETAVLSLGAAALAWLVVRPRGALPWRSLALGAGVAVAVAYVVLSGFFTNPKGPLGYFETFTPWMKRAGGTELHKQSVLHYLQLIVRSEGLIPWLGLIGMGLGVKHSPPVRFATIYTLVLVVVYAAIPYKTPWCALNFLAPLALLAGYAAVAVWERLKPVWLKGLWGLWVLGSFGLLGWQAYQTSFVTFQDSRKNPWVYAQTISDINDFKTQAEAFAKVHPDGFKLVIKVISKDGYYWPLPWTLRRFDQVGYFTEVPADLAAPVVLASPEFDEAVTAQLKETHVMTGFFGLRAGVLYETFVELKLWEKYLKQRGPIDTE